jgi:hypothetical protein
MRVAMAAENWQATGDNVQTDVNGAVWAYNGVTYEGGDVIASFPVVATETVLDVFGTLNGAGVDAVPLKVNGDIRVDSTATNGDVTVNVGSDGPVVLEPYYAPPTSDYAPAVSGSSQVYFFADAGRTITVNVHDDLEFRARTIIAGTEYADYRDLIVTFAGTGKTVFKMDDGTSVWFWGDVDNTTPQVMDVNGAWEPISGIPSRLAGGTKVFVTMEQSAEDIDYCKDKLVFQRANLTDVNDQRILVGFGPNSVFTYLSTDATGEAVSTDGYASVNFDASNNGTGRFVLDLQGAYDVDAYGNMTAKYPFNDAAVLVAGHYVSGFDPASISGDDGYDVGYDFSKPAGKRAVMRVTDDSAYANSEEEVYNPSPVNRRGLLIINEVQSHGKLFSDKYWDMWETPAFSTDPVNGYIGPDMAASNPANAWYNTRFGFVLGVNGRMDVLPNTFAHHVSGSLKCADGVANYDMSTVDLTGLEYIKERTPSAFIVDGIDPKVFITENPFFVDPTLCEFTVADPYVKGEDRIRAQLNLYGTGALFLSSAASSDYGYIPTLDVDDPEYDYTGGLGLGTGVYDGYQLSPIGNADVIQVGEGEHVLDVEGEFDTTSWTSDWIYDSIYAEGYRAYTAATNEIHGLINAASLLLNHQGLEVYFDVDANDYLATGRNDFITGTNGPLEIDGAYDRYQSPTLFFDGWTRLFNTVLRHNDATKYVDGIAGPDHSEPGMTGGEKLYYRNSWWLGYLPASDDPNGFRWPELQLYGKEENALKTQMPTVLELQESLNASGFRFVVTDELGKPGVEDSNFSVVKWFYHGPANDNNYTGFGRTFLCGSSYNQMAAGGLDAEGYPTIPSSNEVTESCQWNVYKHNARPVSGAAATVKLSLQSADQLPVVLLRDTIVPEEQYAQHLFLFSQVTASDPALRVNAANSVCNMTVGWPGSVTTTQSINAEDITVPAGDAALFPYSLPYANEPVVPLADVYIDSVPFSLDALTTNVNTYVPPATVEVAGSVIGVGSFDENGYSIPVPASTDNNQGMIYIKHGGKLGVTRPGYPFAVPSALETSNELATAPQGPTNIPWQMTVDTMLCQKIWNDYNNDGSARDCWFSGIIELKKDQVLFGKDCGLQPYNFTQDMFFAREAQTNGYVRISAWNANETTFNPYNLPRDRSGFGDMVIGWFYRDLTDDVQIRSAAAPARKHLEAGITRAPLTRATESVDVAQTRKYDLLYIGAGDYVNQLKVAGATIADPFVVDISGDGTMPLPARVDEFVSIKSTRDQIADRYIAEGDHARLHIEYGGIVGLGSKSWNEHSLYAWNKLGKDHVQLRFLGSGVVNLNSDLLVTDRLAMLPAWWTDDEFDYGFGYDAGHRITFYSAEERVIRIPAGGELDLSAFGQAPYQQQIAFGGKVKLVLEEGATIRFPDAQYVDGGVVLYFNDESELIFQQSNDPATYLPYNSTTAKIADARCKLIGMGQIWLNKNAHMRINGPVFVGVETDGLTPNTDITVSIQRQGLFEIGNENVAGGTFQVGNNVLRTHVVDEQTVNDSVSFAIRLNGPRATWHIDREGFVGFGAGIIQKNGNPNGQANGFNNPVIQGLTDPEPGFVATQEVVYGAGTLVVPVFNPDVDATNMHGTWKVQSLFNVDYVEISNTQGVIQHSNMFDGSGSNASVMAIGPCAEYYVALNNSNKAIVRGGGNLVQIPSTATLADPVVLNIWDYAGPMKNSSTSNLVWWCSVLGSAPLILDQVDNGFDSTIYGANGKSFDFYIAATASDNMFDLLSFYALQDQRFPKIDIATTQFQSLAAFVNNLETNKYAYCDYNDEIARFNAPSQFGTGDFASALNSGVLGAILAQSGVPQSYTIIS